jgi:hypothetical protein
MHGTVLIVAAEKKLSVRDLFRVAYFRKYRTDPVLRFIDEDVATFHKEYRVPPYVAEYLLAQLA